MNQLPLLGPYHPQDSIAWQNGQPISCASFLEHVAACQETLPDRRYVINLCTDRYRFLVGFAAALLRGQITLLPPNRVPNSIEQVGHAYSPCYLMTDTDETVKGLRTVSVNLEHSHKGLSITNPTFPRTQAAVIAFTSGSTGVPRPNFKTWESLVRVAQKTGSRILGATERKTHVVATVPHQHMYGLETSIMLPIQYGWTFHSGRPFYPEDIRSTLLEIPEKRILVSTPLHLWACLREQTQFPHLTCILSATAPLSRTLAQEVETLSESQIIEIYGFVEAGTIATRRTAAGERWKMLEGLSLISEGHGFSVKTPYFSDPVLIPDSITPHGVQQFDLQGRPNNLINIGGHRASLDDLNHQLTAIDGVTDGVFFMPEDQKEMATRLIAFAVAPGKPPEAILATLKKHIDPVFLPRPLYIVDSLPRNATGKLPKDALEIFAATTSEQHKKGDRPPGS